MRKLLTNFFLFFCILVPPFAYSEVWKEPLQEYSFECGTYGGRLILASNSDPKSFNPIVAKETSTTQVTSFLFEGLTKEDPLTLQVLPYLAESWEAKSEKEWIFHLRKDVYWSDGEKFTADDVVFTYNRLVYNPDIPSSSRDIFTIEGHEITVEKIDDYTVRFLLPSVFAPFLRSLSQSILPRHKYARLVEEKKFTFSMGLNEKPEDIVGTGPFRLKKYFPNEKVILERNPYYWKKDSCGNKLPYLDEVLLVILPNPETTLLKFLEGEIDYYSLRPQDLAVLGPHQNEGFSIYNTGIAFGTTFLVLNQTPGLSPHIKKPYVKPYKLKWFRQKNFRKAISFAINREKIIDVVMNGLGVPQFSPVSPSNVLFYSDKVVTYPYNPARARQLLQSIGFHDSNNDGILEDRDGNNLEINLFTNSNAPDRVIIASLLKKDLEEVGFKINFMPLDFNFLVTKLTATYDWEMILIGLTGGIEPYFGKNVWSYRGALHMWNMSKESQAPYESEIEEIFNRSATTLDEDERRRLFARWQYLVSDNLPLIYTVQGYTIYAVRNKFGNLFPTVYGGAFPEIERLYIKDSD